MQRFFNKIKKTESCWIWTAALRGTGYGCMKFGGKVIDAHRISYILHKGPIPEGMFVCHTCDNRLCVNPEHLFLGTQSDNMRDCKNKNRLIVPVKIAKHPSLFAYAGGCRCDGCKDLHRISNNNWRNKCSVSSVG